MQTGTILRVLRDELRRKFDWPRDICRVTLDGKPLGSSPSSFVGLCDGGCEGSPLDGHFLHESWRVEISVWRALDAYPEDRVENSLLDEDPHAAHVDLPSNLERQVKRFVHFNYQLLGTLNQCADSDSRLQHPLVYLGSGPTQRISTKDSNPPRSWIGRTLHFGGAALTEMINHNDY